MNIEKNIDSVSLIIFILIIFSFILFRIIYRIFEKQPKIDMELWAKSNNLNYDKKIKLSKFSYTFLQNTILKDVIWGNFNNKRMYFFNIVTQNTSQLGEEWNALFYLTRGFLGQKAVKVFSYLNGDFFEELNQQDVEAFLSGNEINKKIIDLSISNIKDGLIEKIIAGIFLDNNIKLEHNFVKKIVKEIGWFKKTELQEILEKKEYILKYIIKKMNNKIDYQTVIKIFDQYVKVIDYKK